jgi:hypothetical protein
MICTDQNGILMAPSIVCEQSIDPVSFFQFEMVVSFFVVSRVVFLSVGCEPKQFFFLKGGVSNVLCLLVPHTIQKLSLSLSINCVSVVKGDRASYLKPPKNQGTIATPYVAVACYLAGLFAVFEY